MFQPIQVRALPGFRLFLRYADGVEGTVDLSSLAGKGVFAIWNEPGVFEGVSIGESGEIRWTSDVDLCPDALYMEISGKSPADLFPNLRTPVDA